MFIVKVKCPYQNCGKSLSDETHLLNGSPASRFGIIVDKVAGTLYLSSIYDDFTSEIIGLPDIKDGDIAVITCPHCGRPLQEVNVCPDCGAPLLKLNLESGGEISICSRKGCRHHGIEFDNSEELMRFFEANSAMR